MLMMSLVKNYKILMTFVTDHFPVLHITCRVFNA